MSGLIYECFNLNTNHNFQIDAIKIVGLGSQRCGIHRAVLGRRAVKYQNRHVIPSDSYFLCIITGADRHDDALHVAGRDAVYGISYGLEIAAAVGPDLNHLGTARGGAEGGVEPAFQLRFIGWDYELGVVGANNRKETDERMETRSVLTIVHDIFIARISL